MWPATLHVIFGIRLAPHGCVMSLCNMNVTCSECITSTYNAVRWLHCRAEQNVSVIGQQGRLLAEPAHTYCSPLFMNE